MAEYLEKTVVTLLSDVSRWSPAAMAFVSDLRSKHLPDHTVRAENLSLVDEADGKTCSTRSWSGRGVD